MAGRRFRAHRAEVQPGVPHVLPDLRDLLPAPDSGLADLDEATVGRQRAHARRDEVARERIQHHVRSAAVGSGQHLIAEIERARVHDVRHTQVGEKLALRGTSRGGEDLGADALRDLHRGQTDSARRRVDEHPLARPQPRQVDERVLGGQEGDRQRGGVLGPQAFRPPDHECGRHRHVAPERAVQRDRQDRIAHREPIDVRAYRGDGARALASEIRGQPRQSAQRIQHVAEVEPAALHPDLDLSWAGHAPARWTADQVVEHAALGDLEPHQTVARPGPARRHRGREEPRHVTLAAAPAYPLLARYREDLVAQALDLPGIPERVEVEARATQPILLGGDHRGQAPERGRGHGAHPAVHRLRATGDHDQALGCGGVPTDRLRHLEQARAIFCRRQVRRDAVDSASRLRDSVQMDDSPPSVARGGRAIRSGERHGLAARAQLGGQSLADPRRGADQAASGRLPRPAEDTSGWTRHCTVWSQPHRLLPRWRPGPRRRRASRSRQRPRGPAFPTRRRPPRLPPGSPRSRRQRDATGRDSRGSNHQARGEARAARTAPARTPRPPRWRAPRRAPGDNR